MTTPQRTTVPGSEAVHEEQPFEELTRNVAIPELPIARELPPWDLLPSDVLLVRRRTVKK